MPRVLSPAHVTHAVGSTLCLRNPRPRKVPSPAQSHLACQRGRATWMSGPSGSHCRISGFPRPFVRGDQPPPSSSPTDNPCSSLWGGTETGHMKANPAPDRGGGSGRKESGPYFLDGSGGAWLGIPGLACPWAGVKTGLAYPWAGVKTVTLWSPPQQRVSSRADQGRQVRRTGPK